MPIVCTTNFSLALTHIHTHQKYSTFFFCHVAFTFIFIRTDLVSFAIDICTYTNVCVYGRVSFFLLTSHYYFTLVVLSLFELYAMRSKLNAMCWRWLWLNSKSSFSILCSCLLRMCECSFFFLSLSFGYWNVIKSNAHLSNDKVCVCLYVCLLVRAVHFLRKSNIIEQMLVCYVLDQIFFRPIFQVFLVHM